MAVKQVEPLKFKGNKVWYLHKLSEKGADAIKCDFPNGDDTFTETTLQAAIEELAANGGGGGGSAESLIPKRVIYINPDKETVAGECYPTFAAAKTYMEAHPTDKFSVELPAGDFGTTADDYITLSEQWEIHGNNTKIVAPIDTDIEISAGNPSFPSIIPIQGCRITKGFVSTAIQEETDPYPLYPVGNCIVTQFATDDSEQGTIAIVILNTCHIDTSTASSASKNSLAMFQIEATGSTIKELNLNEAFTAVIMRSDVGQLVGRGDAKLFLCEISAFALEEINHITAEANFYGCVFYGAISIDMSSQTKSKILHFYNCVSKTQIVFKGNAEGKDEAWFYDCHIYSIEYETTDMAVYVFHRSTAEFDSSASEIRAYDGSSIRVTSNSYTVDSAISNPTSSIETEGTITHDYRAGAIMYSTDGGNNMSNDPTGATHFGVCKNLTKKDLYYAGDYMWFDIPVGE